MEIKPKPPEVKWTDEQWQAIAAEGNNLLVAAAAGSGKTAVLVERIIYKITNTEKQTDLDRLLIVTFTNAAAAEMRHRIGEALEDKIAEKPESLHLKRQLTLLQKANISTLHSFCMNIVREYYYLIDIDPSFRILDDTEGVLLKDEVMESLFDEAYSSDNPSAFYDLVDRYSSDRNDEGLKNIILDLHDFSLSHPNPEEWLQSAAAVYTSVVKGNYKTDEWFRELHFVISDLISEALLLFEQAVNLINAHDGFEKYQETIENEYATILKISETEDVAEQFEQLQKVSFQSLKPLTKKDMFEPEIKDAITNARNEAKGKITTLKEKFVFQSLDDSLADTGDLAFSVENLMNLVSAFSMKYEEEKKEKSVVDFSDLEHYALSILNMNHHGEEIAKQYRDYFVEIMTDEYQDTNRVQEAILRLVSQKDNRFMVGDVKQSIYRFRLADPGLFLEKYRHYTSDGSGDGMVIDLSMNFRSRDEILSSVNYLFKQFMDEKAGELEYDDAAALVTGNLSFPEEENLHTDFHLIDLMKDGNDHSSIPDTEAEEDLSAAEAESLAMIERIQDMLSNQRVYDPEKKSYRKMQYRDIVILVRSMTWSDTFMESFKQAGIPLYADVSKGYFSAIEVQIMLSLLKIIDNPHQDVPLASVLRSPIAGLSSEEMAEIRIQGSGNDFFHDVMRFPELDLQNSEELQIKITSFLNRLKNWRNKARATSLSSFIWKLYGDTGYFDYAGGMPGGKQRQANLKALYDRAKAYEKTSFRGLYRFLKFIEKMEQRGDDLGEARSIGEQEDVVRLMTVHKSKGLEYPVVILPGLNRPFNRMDFRQPYLMHQKLGFGTRWFDPELRVVSPSLPHEVMKQVASKEMLAEEMRVLYVAMTRAKEQLILIGSSKNAEKEVMKWSEKASAKQIKLPIFSRMNANTYLDWMMPAILRHPDVQEIVKDDGTYPVADFTIRDRSKWTFRNVLSNELSLPRTSDSMRDEELYQSLRDLAPVPGDLNEEEQVKHIFEWEYPFEQATKFQSKQTVSELKAGLDSDYSDDRFIFSFRPDFAERPGFLQQNLLKPSEKGTLMHMVMQLIDLQHTSEQELNDQLQNWVSENRLSIEEAKQLNVAQAAAFFKTTIGQEMKQAEEVWRELPFTHAIPAESAYPDWQKEKGEEDVFIQGMVDVIFRNSTGELIMIDYKTDQISQDLASDEAVAAHFSEKYKVQLEFYQKAIESSWNEPIESCLLYLMEADQIVEVHSK
ncbi:helicase-exonuclease AddAB subunit AddA [Salisediminibacterium beveridgei]|uniref:ATP-dependent helicase/nuclease subunit A n=1 Tax=Salisediminibacterium beveridgei TaxID=632773 RepID=A0A1D7QVC7_9BACI|nr:helicase-exonuclease AddAB subunit AddA [Salisediminibacterium beveridgei]AOM82965.1 ATP-dependent helicase/nuclease subunit A [Salisediminibacterium beveridgei]